MPFQTFKMLEATLLHYFKLWTQSKSASIVTQDHHQSRVEILDLWASDLHRNFWHFDLRATWNFQPKRHSSMSLLVITSHRNHPIHLSLIPHSPPNILCTSHFSPHLSSHCFPLSPTLTSFSLVSQYKVRRFPTSSTFLQSII